MQEIVTPYTTNNSEKKAQIGLLNFLGCWVCLGLAKTRVYTRVKLYLHIHDIHYLYYILEGGTGEPITRSRG